jgi:UDP-GlcNAc:undecaprenyl-phosphate GlcNAc-1-phosphate transferase
MLIGLMPLLLIQNGITNTLRESGSRLSLILVPSFLTLLLGAVDDLWGLKAAQKFGGLAVIALVFYAMGGRILGLSIPFIGSVHLPWFISLIVTVIWVVGIANAFNLLDGIDGLSAGAAVFSSLVIMLTSLMQGNSLVIGIALCLCGALVGFLRYNFSPASIFLGDSGALLIGFTLAALSIQGTQKASTAVAVAIPIMACGLPVLDTAFAIVRRFISGKPVFTGDREHIHHKLLDLGWSQRKTALVLYGASAIFGLSTLLFVGTSDRIIGLVLFVVGVAVVLAVSHLRYHEVEEIKASVKRNLSDRRARGVHNIAVRRASRHLAQAESISDLYEAIGEVLEAGQFTKVVMTINANGNAAALSAALSGLFQATTVETAAGMVSWTWSATNGWAATPESENRLWSLRLPITNGDKLLGNLSLYREIQRGDVQLEINYLCTLFQKELAFATQRLLTDSTPEPKALAAHG